MPGKLLYFCMKSKVNSHRRNVGPKLFCGMCPLSAKSAFYLKTQCKQQSWLFKGPRDRKDGILYSICVTKATVWTGNSAGLPFRSNGESLAIHEQSSEASLVLILLLCSTVKCQSPLASWHGSCVISPGRPAQIVSMWKELVETVQLH